MKIGEFAKKYGLKKSSIRYYTDKKLLYPKMNAGFYDYDDTCERDIKDIIEYKDLGFSLEDIFYIVSYKRFSGPLVRNELEIILNILDNKKEEIKNEIEKLKTKYSSIDIHRDKLLQNTNADCYGFPLECIDLLECPNCHHQLKLCQCEVTPKGIINGKVSCPSCSYLNTIENGILNCNEEYLDRPNRKEVNDHKREWQSICEALHQAETKFKESKSFWEDGNIYLFNGADTEIITMSLLDEISQDKIYIFSEKSYDVLQYIKNKIEIKNLSGKFVFICHKNTIPLKKCIDGLIDVFGISMNALYSSDTGCNLETIFPSLSPNCDYLGIYLYIKNVISYDSPFYFKYFSKEYINKLFYEARLKISSSELIKHNIDFCSFMPHEGLKNEYFDIIFVKGFFDIK